MILKYRITGGRAENAQRRLLILFGDAEEEGSVKAVAVPNGYEVDIDIGKHDESDEIAMTINEMIMVEFPKLWGVKGEKCSVSDSPSDS